MADDRPRKPAPYGVPITGVVERQSGRVYRDHRRADEGDVDEFEEEISGVYQGEELRALRAKRPTAKRLERLEVKHDTLAATVTDIKVAQAASHGELNGKLNTLVDLAGAARVERERQADADAQAARAAASLAFKERERKRRHIVPIIKALGVAIALVLAALIGRGAR